MGSVSQAGSSRIVPGHSDTAAPPTLVSGESALLRSHLMAKPYHFKVLALHRSKNLRIVSTSHYRIGSLLAPMLHFLQVANYSTIWNIHSITDIAIDFAPIIN